MENVIQFERPDAFHKQRAKELIKQKKYIDAVKALRRIANYEEKSDVLMAIANVYSVMGLSNSTHLLGDVSYGLFHAANDLLFMALDRNPAENDCYYYVAKNYLCLGDHTAAFYHLNRFCEHNANSEEQLYKFDDIEDLYNAEEMNSYRVVYEKDAGSDAAIDAARDFMRAGKTREAKECIEKSLQEDGENVKILEEKALCHALMGENKEVISCCDRILERDPENIVALSYKLSLAKEEERKAVTEALSSVDAKNPVMKMRVAAAFCDAKQFDKALPLLQSVASEQPYQIEIAFMLAITLANLRRFEEARMVFLKIAELFPHDSIARFYVREMAILKENPQEVSYPYVFQVPMPEVVRRLRRLEQVLLLSAEEMKSEDEELLEWALSIRDPKLQEDVLSFIASLKSTFSKRILRAVLLSGMYGMEFKRFALKCVVRFSLFDTVSVLEGYFFSRFRIRHSRAFESADAVMKDVYASAYAVCTLEMEKFDKIFFREFEIIKNAVKASGQTFTNEEALAAMLVSFCWGSTELAETYYPDDVQDMKTYVTALGLVDHWVELSTQEEKEWREERE